uniref:uncharacterized protein LOC120337630 n=1 Tax=Styela clava TaxID=7725 RepID=UPI00193A88CD|nr:uncharacterized protein LOC120337630 [Styela clava]
MEDWLGDEAANAYLAIPNFPPHIAKYVLSRLKKIEGNEKTKKFNFVMDAGCGNGISLIDYLPYFDKAVGFDASQDQIDRAKERIKSDAVTFLVGREDALPAPDNSVDLLLSVGALHYMKLTSFLGECERILKNTGMCTIYYRTFSKLLVHYPMKDKSQLADGSQFLLDYRNKLHEYFKEIHHPTAESFNRYQNIYDQITGFRKERTDDVTVDYDMTLEELKSFFCCIPTYRKYNKLFDEKSNPVDTMGENLKKLVNADDIKDEDLKLRFTVSMFFIFLYKEI